MKKKLYITALFLLCITLLSIVKSYALFETEANGNGEMSIGKWTILINDEDATFSESVSLDSFDYDDDVHVREGYIAPGVGGNFTIELDADDTDVSMICTIEMDDEDLNDHPNITVEIDSVTKTNLLNSDKDYKVIINHDDLNKSTLITYSLDWTNALAYDEADTELNGEDININFAVHCNQYLGV